MGDDLTASTNEEFQVELESHPTSGAMWQYVSTSSEATLVKEELQPVSDSIGSPAKQLFTFRADRPGRHTLVFELKREWEPTARHRREIIVNVE